MEGWIKLHRKILDDPIIKNPDLLQLFVYCLLRANHKANKFIWGNEEITVERGQFITGRNEIARELNVNSSSVYRRLKKLEKLEKTNIKSNNKYSLVTIVNYDFYQSIEEEPNKATNNKRTTNEQQTNNKRTQTRMKECKNEKNEKKKTKESMYPLQDTADLFNEICLDLPKIKTLSETRKRKLKACFNRGMTIETFKAIFTKTQESDFLSGRNNKWNNCGFDWVLKEENQIKILEGNYDNKRMAGKENTKLPTWENFLEK